jgi:predicted AAA+ superfamily ATPase
MKMYLQNNNLKYFYINFDEVFWLWIWDFKSVFDFIDYLNLFYQTDILKYDFIVFDEIIRVKNFNILLKALIDKYPEKTFFCSSSWEYEIVENTIEWLAWRIIKINVYPLDFEEFLFFKKITPTLCKNKHYFEILKRYLLEYLTFWGYPEVVLTNDIQSKKLVIKSIIDIFKFRL